VDNKITQINLASGQVFFQRYNRDGFV